MSDLSTASAPTTTPPSQWTTGTARVAAGVDVTYDVMGEGEPLLLIMGIGAQRIFWDDRLCAQLAAKGFKVIRFDHRDIGQSSRLNHLPVPPLRQTMLRRLAGLHVDAPYTLSDMARDAMALLSHLAIERAHVVGCSMGGMIAQHIAIEHPSRVLSLTSIMSAPGSRRYLLSTRPRGLKTLFSPPPRTIEAAGDHAVKVFTALGGSRFAPDADSLRRLGRLAFERGSNPRGFLRHFAAICASGSRVKNLARLRVPTLVFHGSEDPLISVSAGKATARAIPGARLHIVKGMGHHMPPGMWHEMVTAIADNAARARA
ncbi:MAG TPA: alpha/beta hydrolase [Kofleriaceae bacterium]|nr:alpha/beta hydrolase [Kofleriaceae bacterium]